MTNARYIYDEKSSALYAPDGTFLKTLHCPKAKQWNQLKVKAGEMRWKKCEECKEKVYDLAQVEPEWLKGALAEKYSKPCLYVSEQSTNVIFIKDPNKVEAIDSNLKTPIRIQTVYGKRDIDRGWNMGYWPDVRLIRADPKFNHRISVGQNVTTGEVAYSGDLRRTFRKDLNGDEDAIGKGFTQLHPFTHYNPYQRDEPVAAYLIPKGLANGTSVVVADPIEIILTTMWNQGGGWGKAKDVPGHIEDNKVILEIDKVKVSYAIG